MMASQKVFQAVTLAAGFRRDRVTGVRKPWVRLGGLDSGPFDKLRVPSMSRDFRRNDRKKPIRTFDEPVKPGEG